MLDHVNHILAAGQVLEDGIPQVKQAGHRPAASEVDVEPFDRVLHGFPEARF